MIAEPKPRKDGRCVVCRKPITTKSRYTEQDGFCTRFCASSYFGVVDRMVEEKEGNNS